MALPIQPSIGGWSSGRTQLSLFIHDFMSDNPVTWAHAIYSAYRLTMKADKTRRGNRTRRAISYASFSNYMYMFRKLGLIEYVLGANGKPMEQTPEKIGEGKVREPWVDDPQAKTKGGAPRFMIRMAPGTESDPAWSNPRRALYG